MKPVRVTLALLGAAIILLLAACGGGQSVPSGAVAVVAGTEIARPDLDRWIAQTKKSYEAQKQAFPKVGTAEYQNIQTQTVAYLVQRAEFEQAAQDLGVKVTDKDIDKAVQAYIDDPQHFGGSRKRFEAALKAQDFPESMFRETIRLSVISQKIYDKVTKDVTVPGPDLLSYYNQNLSSYQVQASRDIRHILISDKSANGKIDYPASKTKADSIYAQLQAGADFASLAKQYSADTGSKDTGGKLTIHRGETVPEFDKTAFALKTGAISKPVKTTYGYHVIQALSNVKPAQTTPFAKAEDSIRATLLQQKKQQFMTDWLQNLNKKYKSKVRYATGFAPPDIPTTTATETQTQ